MPHFLRRTYFVTGALGGLFAAWSGLAGCQDPVDQAGTGGGGGATTTGVTSSAATTSSTAMSSSAGTGGGAGGSGGALPADATITAITTGVIAPGVAVKLTGVVVMSRKYFVSRGSSGSCLWGVYVSEPNLADTRPNSGIRLLSYGLNAAIPPGGNTPECPQLGQGILGDNIPDDTRPGDVLDVLGESAYFLPPQCPSAMGFGEPQVAKVTSAVKTGTTPVPVSHVMSAADLAKLVPPGDPAFQSQWLSVKIRIEDVVSEPRSNGQGMGIVDMFGNMLVHDTSIPVPTAADKLQIATRAFSIVVQAPSFCTGLPSYASLTTTFAAIEGFGAYGPPGNCGWTLQPTNRCLDFTPPSDDCSNPAACN